MFYGLATNGEYFRKRINLFVALAPAVLLHNSKLAEIIRFICNVENQLETFIASIGIREVAGQGWEA